LLKAASEFVALTEQDLNRSTLGDEPGVEVSRGAIAGIGGAWILHFESYEPEVYVVLNEVIIRVSRSNKGFVTRRTRVEEISRCIKTVVDLIRNAKG